jgi:putative Holliday junction resolvase
MVILGIDFGDKRMGTAICDRDERMAVSIQTVQVRGAKDAATRAAALAQERKAEAIVVGMPERAGGYRGERCEKTEVFLNFLKEMTDVPVMTHDERFTTVQARTMLYETGLQGRSHTSCVDALSAQLILQSYLDQKHSR